VTPGVCADGAAAPYPDDVTPYHTFVQLHKEPHMSVARRSLSITAAVSAAVLLAVPAVAAVRNEHTFKLTLAAKTTKTSSAVSFSTDRNYTAPAAGTKPVLVTKVVFALPKGTKINVAVATPCSVATLQTQGSAGCKAKTAIGGGTAVAITGTALDPVKEQVAVYATKTGMAAYLTGLQTVVIPLTVKGSRLTAVLPRICLPPGTLAKDCPTGEIVLKTLDIKLKAKTKGSGASAKRLVTTPPACASGTWKSSATYTFSNGDTDVQTSTSKCHG
jgi:hypothetical protein